MGAVCLGGGGESGHGWWLVWRYREQARSYRGWALAPGFRGF